MARTGERRFVWILWVALVFGAFEASARPTLEATLSPAEVGPGQSATYKLTIRNADDGELSLPRFGALSVSGPSKANQSVFKYINGKTQSENSQIYTWYVSSPDEGTYLIGPAVIEVGGEKYSSNTVELTVSSKATQPRQNTRRQNPFAGTPFGSLDPFDAFDALDDESFDPWATSPRGQGDVQLSAVLDKKSVYLGEQATLSLYLLTRANVTGVQSISFPKLDGFWAEDLESPTQLVPESRTIDGVHYNAYLLRRRALFPLKAGKLVIDPVEAQINLGIALFLGAQNETVKRRSPSVELTVKPLPVAGRPPDFEAAHVGNWRMTTSLSSTEATLGQPVQLKVTVEGGGNVKNVKLPKPALPEGLKTYEPTVDTKPTITGRRYGGSRQAEWVIVPERTGSYVIPALEFDYFDPSTGTYKKAKSKGDMTINVSAGNAPALVQGAGSVMAPTATNVLTGGLRPIRSGALLVTAKKLPWERGWFWPLTLGPMALFGLVLVGAFFSSTLRARDPRLLREKKARAVAFKRLDAARARLEGKDSAGFLAEVEGALLEYVTDRLGVAARGLTKDELRETLRGRSMPAEAIAGLVDLLEKCETSRFMPGATTPEALGGLLSRAQKVLEALEAARTGRS